MLGGHALIEGQRSDGAVGVLVNAGTDGVDTSGFQPLLAPGLKVATGGLLQFGEQVGERGVAVRVLVKVVVDTFEELAATNIGDELLEHGRTLRVGDAIEVHIGVVQVIDRRNNRVGGRQLVLRLAPALLAGAEGRPRVMPFSRLRGGERRHEFGEGFVQPQVVPPLHGHVIAEPHVGELVQHGDHAALGICVGHLGFEHVLVADSDHADVLHRARIVFRHEDLVVLGVRVRHTPGLGVEREALLGDVKQVIGVLVERILERLTAVERHWDGTAVLVRVFSAPLRIRAGTDRGQVGAHHRGGLKRPLAGAFRRMVAERTFSGDMVHVLRGGDRHIRRDNPALRGEHMELKNRLEIRLIEDRIDTTGVRHLELGVQVYVAVGGVDAAMQAFASTRVLAAGGDGDLVVLEQPGQFDAVVAVGGCRVKLLAVEGDRGDVIGDQVEERARAGIRAESDGGGRTEIRCALSQV